MGRDQRRPLGTPVSRDGGVELTRLAAAADRRETGKIRSETPSWRGEDTNARVVCESCMGEKHARAVVVT